MPIYPFNRYNPNRSQDKYSQGKKRQYREAKKGLLFVISFIFLFVIEKVSNLASSLFTKVMSLNSKKKKNTFNNSTCKFQNKKDSLKKRRIRLRERAAKIEALRGESSSSDSENEQ